MKFILQVGVVNAVKILKSINSVTNAFDNDALKYSVFNTNLTCMYSENGLIMKLNRFIKIPHRRFISNATVPRPEHFTCSAHRSQISLAPKEVKGLKRLDQKQIGMITKAFQQLVQEILKNGLADSMLILLQIPFPQSVKLSKFSMFKINIITIITT